MLCKNTKPGRVRHKLQDSGHLCVCRGRGGRPAGEDMGLGSWRSTWVDAIYDNILNIPAICHTNLISLRKPSLIPISKSPVPPPSHTVTPLLRALHSPPPSAVPVSSLLLTPLSAPPRTYASGENRSLPLLFPQADTCRYSISIPRMNK